MDQIELINQCRLGSRKAQHELFRLYARPMYHVAWRIVGDSMESEEVVQEAFIKVFSRLDQFEGKATLGAWIKRIVINQALNAIRKKKVYTQDVDEVEIAAEENEEVVAQPITVDEINQAIQNLPTGSRVIVGLHLLEDYKHTEIAQMLDISESTSRSQYMRGRKMLAEELKIRMART